MAQINVNLNNTAAEINKSEQFRTLAENFVASRQPYLKIIELDKSGRFKNYLKNSRANKNDQVLFNVYMGYKALDAFFDKLKEALE